MKRKALALAVALSLTPMAAVAGNAPRYSDSGKVRGCFLRMPQRCQEVCAASGVSNPSESECFAECRKQCASIEEFREDFKRMQNEKK
jgi:hypothetical protein